ncbi:hypothetical protein LTR28_006911 [Elasticomyces elasticus]|nr:hypothetical protein LTR28_006911 [Elasticomyces elasticus]
MSSANPPLPTPTPNIFAALSAHLASKALCPSQAWLSSFLSTTRPSTPLPALQKTALFRFLATDITTTSQPLPTAVLPTNIADGSISERIVRGSVVVQVLDIDDIGRSRWSQVEALEAAERGETTKGREIIRVVPNEDGNAADTTQGAQEKSSGPHKLLLQDAKGLKVYGFELHAVEGISLSMSIGAKLRLRDVTVARGVVLLEPRSTEVLGGKVEAWEKKWRDGRKDTLKAKAGIRDGD